MAAAAERNNNNNNNNNNNDNNNNHNNNNNNNNNLRELLNERHPVDVRVKVGSERESVTSDNVAKFRCRRDRWISLSLFSAGPPLIDGFHWG